MSPQPNVMVTGSTGFIGRRLTARLQAEGWRVTTWSQDIRKILTCQESVEIVYHLAAITQHQHFHDHPHESYDVNVSGTQAVLNYCYRVGARCVFVSTSGVYDADQIDGPLVETAPLKPTLPYGISKWLAENLCRQQAESHYVPVVILRLFNVYGPSQHPSFFVPYIVNNLWQGIPLVLRMPNAQRDFVFVDDVVEALLRAKNVANRPFTIFNIGSGYAIQMIDFVRLAEKILERSAVGIETIGAHAGEVVATIADIQQANQRLSWFPQVDLPTGLMAIKRYLQSNQS